jgi:hypothetical protein
VGKVIKISIKVFIGVLLVLFSIPTTIWIVIQDFRVQTWLVGKATQIIEDNLGASVTIEKFDYRPFNKVLLRNVFIQDLNGDTLIYAKTITANLLRYSSSKNLLSFQRVTLENASINFLTDTSGTMNLTEFVQIFRSKKEKTNEKYLIIDIRNASFVESTFKMHKDSTLELSNRINFQDLLLNNLNLEINNITIASDTISFTINDLSFFDKSGFTVDRFRSEISFSSKHMDFEKLRVRSMASSLNIPFLKLSYSNWSDMSDFINTVDLNGSIDKSILSTRFLSYFVSAVSILNEVFSIEGSFRGPISDFRLRNFVISTKSNTNLQFNASLTGLPDFNNTLLFADFKNLSTTIVDVKNFKNIKTGKQIIDLPENLNSLERVSYSGNFTGFISDFVAYGTIKSAIGNLSIDLSFKPGAKSRTNFNGNLSTNELNLGKLLDNKMLGYTSLKATVKGSTDYKNHLEATTDANIFAFEANDYRYTNIDISGNLSNKTFVGSLFLDDPNAKMNFLGKVDLADTIPVFDFSAFVPKLDLVKLNFNKADSISQISFLLTAKFSGNNLDNSQGEIKIVNCFYKNQNGEVKTADITINANNTADSKHIAIKSEFIDGELRGKYNYANIFNSFEKLVYLYIPALSPDNQKTELEKSVVENPEYNDYIVRLRVKKTQKLTDVIIPGFRIAENTNVFGIYNPDFQTLTVKVSIPELVIAGNVIKNISIEGQTNDSTFVASISTPNFDYGGTFVRNISLKAEASNNNINSSLSWDNRTTIKNQGEILASTMFKHSNDRSGRIEVNFLQSAFFLNDTIWNITPSNIFIDSTAISINNFGLQNKKQRLNINGKIASSETDTIRVDLENIDISNLNLYTKGMGYEFMGEVDGYAMVTDITKAPIFFADLVINNTMINNQLLGNLSLGSQWFADDKRLSVSIVNKSNNEPTFIIGGDIFPESKIIDLKATINEFKLNYIEPLLADNVQDIEGNIAGSLNITGTFERPVLNGTLRVIDAAGTIDFTRTRYRMSDPIVIENSNIQFRNFRLYDSNNRIATLNGSVRTNFFKDISLDLSLTPNNFQFLNTTERDNELFYGTVYATGQVRVTGSPSNIVTNVSVRTEPRTAIFLPLSSSREVADHDFVSFINRSSEIFIFEESIGIESVKKLNLSLTLDMQVTPEAEVQIIIDKQLGDIIRANGSGNLKMEINPTNDVFNMFGQYVIERGDYLFTLQGVINKRFRIGQGSTITWNGQVDDAIMDINAIYSLRTTLGPLNPGSTEEIYGRRTQVDCYINLAGKLMEPNIGFDIKVPIAETDESVNAIVQNALNTDERMSKQFLSLLVINNFTSDLESQGGGFVGQGLASTASEMLSNQLSNWLSQWSSAFDIGLNWRPGDEVSSNEIELALSTQLFDNRLIINSNVDMGGGDKNVGSPIAGDFSAELKIVPSGKIRLKAFARSNDDVIDAANNQNDYTTGVGLMYREDFNTLNELWRRYMSIFRRKEETLPENEYTEASEDSTHRPL